MILDRAKEQLDSAGIHLEDTRLLLVQLEVSDGYFLDSICL